MTKNRRMRREGIPLTRNLQEKRRLANLEACRADLKDELPLIAEIFANAINKANRLIAQHPPATRSRTLAVSVIQSCYAEFLFRQYGARAYFGRYRRLVLSKNGYLFLFKKLDKKGYPMNIKTQSVQEILNQSKTLNLFGETGEGLDPILYIGYQMSSLGTIIRPQIIYIDEGVIQFRIDLPIDSNLEGGIFEAEPIAPTGDGPKLKIIEPKRNIV